MKTVVFGLFDNVDDARRVLAQISRSPLDLDAVAVVHADPELQLALADEAGLPGRRSVTMGLVAGAVAGGALGYLVGGGVLSALGPLLAAAGGVLVGGAAGAATTALGENLRLPDAHARELAAAVDAGATVVLVRAGGLPTARALRDLFLAGGSRTLPPLPDAAVGDGQLIPLETPQPPVDWAPSWPASHAARPESEPGHDLFAPPWRRTPSSVRVPPGVAAAIAAGEADVLHPEEDEQAEAPLVGPSPDLRDVIVDAERANRPEDEPGVVVDEPYASGDLVPDELEDVEPADPDDRATGRPDPA